MADNYDQCTVDPYLPTAWLSEHDQINLEEQGFSLEKFTHPELGEVFYIYAEEGTHEPWEAQMEDGVEFTEWTDVLQGILKRNNSDMVITIQGSYTCSKMRMGEFGGYVTVLNKDRIFCGSTQSLVSEYEQAIKDNEPHKDEASV